MVNLAAIASATGVKEPDLLTVYRYLEDQALPVAEVAKPFPIIAPAVNRLHSRAKTLEFDLTAANLTPERLRTSVSRAFSEVADCYSILSGVSPPKNPVEAQLFSKEKEFARKLLAVCFRVFIEIGGKPEPKWDVVMIPEGRRESLAAEIKVLRAEHPFPEFAQLHNIQRRSARLSIMGWIVLAWIILIQMGLLGPILAFIESVFRKE